jgi:hypothetical protein
MKKEIQATASAKAASDARQLKVINHILTTPEGDASIDNFVKNYIDHDGPDSPNAYELCKLFNQMVVNPVVAKF